MPEVAPAYVLLASDEASYISGARLAVTGVNPLLKGRSKMSKPELVKALRDH